MKLIDQGMFFYFISLVFIRVRYSYQQNTNCFLLESLNPHFLNTWELYYDSKKYIINQALLSNSKTQKSLPILPAESNAHGYLSNSTPINVDQGVIDVTFELFDKKHDTYHADHPKVNQKEIPNQGFGLWLDISRNDHLHSNTGVLVFLNVDKKNNVLSLYLKQFGDKHENEQLITGQYLLEKLFFDNKLRLNVNVNNKTISVFIRGKDSVLYKTLSIDHRWSVDKKTFYMGITSENSDDTEFPVCNSVFVTELNVEGSNCDVVKEDEENESHPFGNNMALSKRERIEDELKHLKTTYGTNIHKAVDHLNHLFEEYDKELRHQYTEDSFKKVADLTGKLNYLTSLIRLIHSRSLDNDILEIESVLTDSMEHINDTFKFHHNKQNEKLVQIHEQIDKHNDKVILEAVQQIEANKKDNSYTGTSKITIWFLSILACASLIAIIAIYNKIVTLEKRHIL